MSSPRATSDPAILGYSVLTGVACAVLPAVIDLPLVHALRGAMFEQMSRAERVTLTGEARRILVDLEAPATRKGALSQAVRFVATQVVPGFGMVDAGRNLARTYAAGALYRRYLGTHRPEPRDSVLGAIEAARVRSALLRALPVDSLPKLRALAAEALAPFRRPPATPDASVVQRYTDAAWSTVAELPAAWLDARERAFAAALAEP